jgi:flagellar biosynthesis protein FlhA
MGLFAVIPGLPALPFLALSVALGVTAWMIGRRIGATPAADGAAAAAAAESPGQAPALREVLAVEPLEVEVGYGLVPLVDETQGGDLLQRIGIMRKQLALDLGMLVPAARIRDNIRLAPGEYAIKVRGVRIAGSQLMPRHRLALDTRGGLPPIEGVPTREPSFDLPAVWIDPAQVAAAEAAGYVVVEPQTVLVTHLTEVVREHAAELLSRQAVRELLDGLKETHPALVEDVVPNKLSLGGLQRVLQRLLKEGIPVRDLVTILESLSDAADQTKDPEQLAEHARRAQATLIAQALGADAGALRAITVGPALEVALMQLFAPRARDAQSSLDARELSEALHTLTALCEGARRDGHWPPLVAPPALRVGIRRLLEPILPRLPVISLAELPPQTPIEPLAIWELERAA